MTSDRDRLIELIEGTENQRMTIGLCCTVDEVIDLPSREEYIANYLIANGVTGQTWISVKDRLPKEGEYVLCVLKGCFNYGGKIQVCKFVPADKFKDKPYFEHFRNGFPSVTHWMPLPDAPKGEKQ